MMALLHAQRQNDGRTACPNTAGRHPIGWHGADHCRAVSTTLFDNLNSSNDRLGGVATSLSHSKFSSAQDDGLPPPVVRLTQRADVCPARYRHVTLSPDAANLPRVGNWGAFIAAPLYPRLTQHLPCQRTNAAPSHPTLPFMNSRSDALNKAWERGNALYEEQNFVTAGNE